MDKESYPQGQNPLILRFHRLMDAFAKSDDERDFYLDLIEGFIIFIDLDKNFEELALVEKELEENSARYRQIPKMTFYETKKFMEGFVNEKVYDIDTKEKLLDIIGSKEARENFLEFVYDHLTELEKWQQYYYERARIHIIEWLRSLNVWFVFEEDLDINKYILEQVKHHFFDVKVSKEIQHARSVIKTRAKTYYSSEALNPRPKRGRPPKQAVKVEVEPQHTNDIYKTVPSAVRPYLFITDYTGSPATFSAKYDTEAQIFATLRGSSRGKVHHQIEAISQRLEALCHHQLADLITIEDGVETEHKEKLQEIASPSMLSSQQKGGKISGIVKGLLPKERNRMPRKKELQKLLKQKEEAGIKQVTQIKRSSKKRREK